MSVSTVSETILLLAVCSSFLYNPSFDTIVAKYSEDSGNMHGMASSDNFGIANLY